MKKLLLSIITLGLAANAGYSQTAENESYKKFKMADIQFSGYFTTYSPQLVDYTAISNLATSVDDLQVPDDINTYTRRNDSQEGSQGTVAIYASIALNPFNKKKGEYNEKQIWRMGLSFRDINTYESSYNLSIPTGFDTLSQTRDYFVNAGQSALLIETSYSISTDSRKPVHAFIGLGAQFGFTVGSNLEVNTNFNEIIDLPDGGTETTFTPNSFIVNGQNSLLWSAYVPAGVHIRVRKNLGILTELRYAIAGNSSSAAGLSFTRPEFFAGVGLRYTLGAIEGGNNESTVF